MTSQEIRETVKRNGPAARWGLVVGLVIVLGLSAWWAGDRLLAPVKPNLRTASAAELVAYVADPRGLARLSRFEQGEFLKTWKETTLPDEKRRIDLAESLEALSAEEKKSFVKKMTTHFKRAFLNDAERYGQLRGTDEAFAFIRERHKQFNSDALFFREFAAAFQDQFDTRPDKIQEMILRNTTPEERAIGEPYHAALVRMREQIRKERRADGRATNDGDESRS